MQNFAKIIFIVSSSLIFLLLPALILTYLTPYYIDAFRRYDVYATFAKAQHPVDEVNARFTHVLGHIQPPFNEELEPEFFSAEDIAHMRDVQRIFQIIYLILGVSLILELGSALTMYYANDANLLTLSLKQAEQVTTVIFITVIITGIIALMTWQRSFILFHQLLFPTNNFWQLNPATSNLIKFFPDGIFQELALLYITFLALELVSWRVSSFLYHRSHS